MTTLLRVLIPATILSAVAVTLFVTGAVGDDATIPEDPGAPVMGMCHESQPDCVDTVVEPGVPDELPPELVRTGARALLGVAEGDVPEEVRVGRRDEEHFALTEDYVIGRITVELDERGDTYVVTAVTVELPDGPETFTLAGS